MVSGSLQIAQLMVENCLQNCLATTTNLKVTQLLFATYFPGCSRCISWMGWDGWWMPYLCKRSQRVSAGMFYRGEQTGNLLDHGKGTRKVCFRQAIKRTEAKALRLHAHLNFPAAFITYCATKNIKRLIFLFM